MNQPQFIGVRSKQTIANSDHIDMFNFQFIWEKFPNNPVKKVYGVPEGVADHAIPKKFRVKLAKTSQSEEQNGVGIGIGKHPPSNVAVG